MGPLQVSVPESVSNEETLTRTGASPSDAVQYHTKDNSFVEEEEKVLPLCTLSSAPCKICTLRIEGKVPIKPDGPKMLLMVVRFYGTLFRKKKTEVEFVLKFN